MIKLIAAVVIALSALAVSPSSNVSAAPCCNDCKCKSECCKDGCKCKDCSKCCVDGKCVGSCCKP